MACRINLRNDQTSKMIEASQRDSVTIYAPTWVEEGLKILAEQLNGVTFQVLDHESLGSAVIEEFTLGNQISLRQLQMITRNEPRNVHGLIALSNYQPAIPEDKNNVIYSLKDLVRSCVIVGQDETVNYGGYPYGQPKSSRRPVYIADLIGLQFQQRYNTGRLVLISDGKLPAGLLDDFIFENVVGERKKSFEEVQDDTSGRYEKQFSKGHLVYFDSLAYKRFVAQDVILTGIALDKSAAANQHELNFKFLKYGTGHFAGEFSEHLETHIFPGVVDGLERLFDHHLPKDSRIKSMEFPYFKEDSLSVISLKSLKAKYKINFKFGKDDALKMTSEKGYVTATTNCADPHAAIGNEMNYSSVDAAIATNLLSKGNIFCPCLNKKIQSKFVKTATDTISAF